MTDRELLELAAKAAGIKLRWWDNSRNGFRVCNDKGSVCKRLHWNPIEDDCDALRLSVELGLSIRIAKKAGFTWVKGFEGATPHRDNPHEATRRAITRAAAEIGKAMP